MKASPRITRLAHAFELLRARSVVALCEAALLLALQPALFAQTTTSEQKQQAPSPSPSLSPEATRIDQLITECRQQMSKGSFDGISQKADEALVLSRKIGDKVRQSRSLMYIALGMFHTGQTEEAIEPFKQSASLAGEAGETKLQTVALNSAGVLLEESGRLEDSLYFYNQSLALSRQRKDRRGEATALRNIGRIHAATRDYLKANETLQASLEISRELKDAGLEHAVLDNLGSLENQRGNFELALNYVTQASKIEGPDSPPSLKYQRLSVEAVTHYQLGNLEKCSEVLLQALDFARSQKIPPAEATILGNLADLQFKLGKNGESLASSSQALALLRRIGGDPAHEAAVLYTRAQALRSSGKSEEALANLRQAITLLERARIIFVPTESARAQLVAKNSHIFEDTIAILLEQGKEEEALAVSESYHGRAFLDSLVESRADVRRVLPKEFVEKENNILNQISNIQREIWQEGISQEHEQQLRKNLAVAENDLEEFHLEVRHSNPQYANLKHPQLLTTQSMQRELLEPDVALLEYVVGEDKSFAWLVSKDKVAHAVLPAQKELTRLVTEYRKSIAERLPGSGGRQSVASLSQAGRQLYQILVRPFEADLISIRKLIIVPDHALAYLPFETLVTDRSPSSDPRSQYLLERFAVSYAPSGSALAAVKANSARAQATGFMAFGDPVYQQADLGQERSAIRGSEASRAGYYLERGLDLRRLPYTRTEVTSIGLLFPVADRKVFLGAEANEEKVKSEPLAHYRYVHFATHGVVDEENPLRSGVILSLEGNEKEDGVLQVSEIMRLKLNADLVTLSACRTGMGKVVNGEGVLGLTRAFIYAGTRSVVASLWNVNDTATAELMKEFYQNLKRGMSKDEALRQAKLRLLRGKQQTWHHPYFWASFVLVGASN